MPITKSALKALRQQHTRTAANKPVRSRMKSAQESFRSKPGADLLANAFSSLDRAAKRHIIHKNKASRLKSRLSKLLAK